MVTVTKDENKGTNRTDIDLNTNATTTVYTASRDAKVYFVYLPNGGGTAEFNLELTDGTDTTILDSVAAGADLSYKTDFAIPEGEELQINVTTVEGTAQTNTCVVSRGEEAKAPSG